MTPRRFALIGAGFWAPYQLAAWGEIPGAQCVAVCDRARGKAQALAARFGIPAVYDDAEALLACEMIDFVDIVTDADSHATLAALAAARGRAVICQKPLAPSLAEAERMIQVCRQAGVPLLVHENWRWQPQIRAFAAALGGGGIGRPWRAQLHYASSFPAFDFQPALKDLRQFILMDMGTHLCDTLRFLFDEPESVYALAHSVAPGIRGEDAVSALIRMRNGLSVSLNLRYASRVPGEAFPQTFLVVEGEDASLALGPDYTISHVTRERTVITRHPPPHHAWADSRFAVAHASIVETNRHLLAALDGRATAETTGEDNLRTLRFVFACYESIRTGAVVRLDP